ncbi:MAG: phage portal protein [Bryobacteraceae bacterium]
MELNWLDRTLDWISPSLGLRRVKARKQAEIALAYDAVRSDRRKGGWNPNSTSGDYEIGVSLVKMRDQARALYRDNPFARRISREFSKRAVGYGLTPQCDTGNPALNATVDGYWLEFVRNCSSDQRTNFYAEQKRIALAAFVSGECLIRMWNRRPEDGLAVPFQIQVIESDLLDHGKTETLKDGWITQGVEFDLLGHIRGYWLFGQHPGGIVQMPNRTMTSKFVSAEYVLYHGELERPGDARAVTRLSAVMNTLRDLEEYMDANLFKKKIEACFAVNVETAEGPDGAPMGQRMTDANGRTVEKVEPGMVTYTGPGQKVSTMAPSVNGDFPSDVKTYGKAISSGSGVPYVTAFDDLEAVNYSSYRGGAISFREDVEEYRYNWLIPQVLDPIWQRFIDTLILKGAIPQKAYPVKWNPPPFDLLDRRAEAEADEIELRIGKTSFPELCGKQGVDPEKRMKEIEQWKPRLDKAGVTFNPKGAVNGDSQNPPPVS